MHTTDESHLYRRRATDSSQSRRTNITAKGGSSTLAAVGMFLTMALLGCAKEAPPEKPAPPDVEVATAIQQNVPIYTELVCQLNGAVNAEITPKVQGYLLQQNYQNGFSVKKGQLLFTLDPRQFQAAVEEASAQVGIAEANLAHADNDVARDTPLAAQRAIAQRDLDTDLTTQQAQRAQVEAAKANLVNAKLNLTWTKVYSPIDGIAGVSNSQIGDLVGTSTKMTTVSQVNPIWAYFNVSEGMYLKFAPLISEFVNGRVGRGARPSMPVELIQANDVPYPQTGRIIYVNRQVGTQTGTIQMAAEFPNRQSVLRPGGFGRVRIKTGDNENALLVPQPHERSSSATSTRSPDDTGVWTCTTTAEEGRSTVRGTEESHRSSPPAPAQVELHSRAVLPGGHRPKHQTTGPIPERADHSPGT